MSLKMSIIKNGNGSSADAWLAIEIIRGELK